MFSCKIENDRIVLTNVSLLSLKSYLKSSWVAIIVRKTHESTKKKENSVAYAKDVTVVGNNFENFIAVKIDIKTFTGIS